MDEGVDIIVEDLSGHPVCEHGPTILFEHRKASGGQKYFACAAYRDRKDCAAHIPFELWCNRTPDHSQPSENVQLDTAVASERRQLLHKVLEMKPSKRCFCHTCGIFVSDDSGKQACTRLSHDLQQGVTNDQLDRPTTFLRAKSNDKKEAQYFFADESLKCFAHIFQQLNINKIVCIGAPRLHEYLRSQRHALAIQSVLLDFDDRFYSFYNRTEPPDFYHYNMFNDHFFGGAACEPEFEEFLRCTDADKCCIFTDPPFGCRTELLAASFHTLNEKYRRKNGGGGCSAILPIFLVLPYFMEHYVQLFMPQMTMFDYKVNYTNHSAYKDGGRKLGSAARLFANVLPHLVRLPASEQYRQCGKCNKWVAAENRHCNRCRTCPSKNGAAYRHCRACEQCVKPSYKHCFGCWRCTQSENHRCADYQATLTCMICTRRGHNEPNCSEWFALCGKKRPHIERLRLKVQKTGQRICFVCFKSGHTEGKCTQRAALLAETTFLGRNYNKLSMEAL